MLSTLSDKGFCFGAGGGLVWWGGVAGEMWQGGGEAVMGNGVCRESGCEGMGSGSGDGKWDSIVKGVGGE